MINSPFAERKILGHLPVLGQYLSGETYPPIQVEIDLTNICTSACPWCAGFEDRELHPFILFGSGKTKQEQWDNSRNRVIGLIDELVDYGVKSLAWTGGGDPSVHPHLTELVKYAHDRGLDNGLITNGVIDVVECLPYCQWVRFSVDAATEEGYEKQHGRKHHFPRVLDHIAQAVSKKKVHGWPCTIGVGFVTAPDMEDEIVPFAWLWKGVPLDYIQYRPINDNYGRHYEADKAAILKEIERARIVDSRVVKSDAKYNAWETGETGMTDKCHGIFVETAIAADGCVYACCHLKSLPQYSLGSLHEESFRVIWERHLAKRGFNTTYDCTRFCRHFGLNCFVERDVLIERTHENFI